MPIITENQSKYKPFLVYYDTDPASGVGHNGAVIDTGTCGAGIFFFMTAVEFAGTEYEYTVQLMEGETSSLLFPIAQQDPRLVGSYDNLNITASSSQGQLLALGVVNTLRYIRISSGVRSGTITAGQAVCHAVLTNDNSPTDLLFYNAPNGA